MEDSNILYYLVLGAIYIISRVLKKKKPQEQPAEPEEQMSTPVPKTTSKRPSSVEDLLKELTKEFVPEEPKRPVQPQESKPSVFQERKPEPVRQVKQPDYQNENIEAVGPDEMIDIVPHKQIEREKPEYKRSEKFALDQEENDTISGIYDLLEEEDGPRKAVVMKEIFDRKY